MAGDELRHVVVLHPREGLAGARLRPVAEHDGRRRECLSVDPEPLHVLDPPLRPPRSVVDLTEDGLTRHDGGPAGVARDQARPAASTVPRREGFPALGDDVRVEVDPHRLQNTLAPRAGRRSCGAGRPCRTILVGVSAPLLSIEGVSKEFESRGKRVLALDSVDLAVAEGEFVTIVGPSGCGKSTLLNLTVGLMRPSAGRILF